MDKMGIVENRPSFLSKFFWIFLNFFGVTTQVGKNNLSFSAKTDEAAFDLFDHKVFKKNEDFEDFVDFEDFEDFEDYSSFSVKTH